MIEDYLARNKKLIDSALRDYLPRRDAYTPALQRAIRYSLFPGGKRLRPLLAIAAYNACGGKGKTILPFACALEMIHTFFLIHDDLPALDNDTYRRGRLTVHKKFGEATAILAGDNLLILAFSVMSKAKNSKVTLEVIKEISNAIGLRGVIAGQAAEIEARLDERRTIRPRRNERRIKYVHTHKTAALIEAAVTVGAIIAAADRKKIDSLAKFGRDFGFAFQVNDDILDSNGYAKIWGKKKAREKAAALTKQAIKHLERFGKKADALREIANLCLGREEKRVVRGPAFRSAQGRAH